MDPKRAWTRDLLARVAEPVRFAGVDHREISQALGCGGRTSVRSCPRARGWIERWIEPR